MNTIHCGSNDVVLLGDWGQGAQLAEGTYRFISQDVVVVHVSAPQDKEILRLNKCLNETCIPFGAVGAEKKIYQIAQDSNAKSKASAGADVQRALTKASANYWNATWDLADRSLEKDFDWSKVSEAQLPEAMRELDLEERKKYVASKIAKRQEIQAELKKLNNARVAYVDEKRKESSPETAQTLDKVVTQTVREQATSSARIRASYGLDMENPTILVVEDDAAVSRGVVDALTFTGYAVLSAADGEAGKAQALSARYDLLLLDLVLPHFSGFEILGALKKERQGQAVIILSAKG